MNDTALLEHLKNLLRAPGLPGDEASVREIIAAAWKPFAPLQSVSRLGSLHAVQSGSGRDARPNILLSAHMDTVGLTITRRSGGFCRVTEIGGIDPRILPGLAVTIHGREDVPAAVILPPASLLPPDRKAEAARLADLWLDPGLPEEEAARLIRTGDPVSFAQTPIELCEGRIAGRALDDRAGIAALTLCLEELGRRPHAWDVVAAATVQEEETLAGARTSAFQLRPELAIAVDTTYGAAPGLPEHKTFPLGGGPAIGLGPNIHPALHRALTQAADRARIPHAVEVLAQRSGTEAHAMQTVAEGIPTAVVSIPLRNMHTSVETAALEDIRRTGKLLAETIASLDDGFLAKLTWE